jgi:hypothetical protein
VEHMLDSFRIFSQIIPSYIEIEKEQLF